MDPFAFRALNGRMKRIALVLVFSVIGCGAAPGEDTESNGENRESIVGGTATSAFPAVGALTKNGSPFCTGTVIAPRRVATAAHCLTGIGISGMRFAFGQSAFAPTQTIAVVAIQPHPSYDDAQLTNDIGVVTLASDAPVTPIKILGSMDKSWVGKSLTFVGYGVSNGKTQTGGGTKRSVTMPISQVWSTQFAYQTAGKNTCNGDSGGPAFANVNGELFLAGTTSYGDATCTQYGVDTRADAFASFLGASQAPPPPPQDPCKGETYAGRCSGKTVIWCDQNQVHQFTCSNRCGLNANAGYYDCL
jgi:secreted trypsin-like serine protease